LGATGCVHRPCTSGSAITAPVAGPTVETPSISQVAFSVIDLDRTRGWYHDMLGFLPSGGTNNFGNIFGSWVQGLPNVIDVRTKWMVDRQEFMQLEMFEFASPVPKPRPKDRRANDIGYMMAGLHVTDFDSRLTLLQRAGVQPLTEPMGAPGFRRVCIQDPEGNLIELMEDDPQPEGSPLRPRLRPNVPVVVRSMSLSVPNLERSRRFFVDTLRCKVSTSFKLHGPQHEELWGLKDATADTLLLWAGDFMIELRQYTDPKGKPWPDGYRISDQGFLNIAFGFRKRKTFEDITERLKESGYRGNSPPIHLFDWGVQYVNDDQCFSIELLFVEPEADREMGFVPEAGVF
jgi:catechol 2,3-dioxygenase-like lactoylglutathione lyase family enzyme